MISTFLCCLSSSRVRPAVRGLPFCFLIPFWQSYGIYSLARASPAVACVSSCWGKENCWGQYHGGPGSLLTSASAGPCRSTALLPRAARPSASQPPQEWS